MKRKVIKTKTYYLWLVATSLVSIDLILYWLAQEIRAVVIFATIFGLCLCRIVFERYFKVAETARKRGIWDDLLYYPEATQKR